MNPIDTRCTNEDCGFRVSNARMEMKIGQFTIIAVGRIMNDGANVRKMTNRLRIEVD